MTAVALVLTRTGGHLEMHAKLGGTKYTHQGTKVTGHASNPANEALKKVFPSTWLDGQEWRRLPLLIPFAYPPLLLPLFSSIRHLDAHRVQQGRPALSTQDAKPWDAADRSNTPYDFRREPPGHHERQGQLNAAVGFYRFFSLAAYRRQQKCPCSSEHRASRILFGNSCRHPFARSLRLPELVAQKPLEVTATQASKPTREHSHRLSKSLRGKTPELPDRIDTSEITLPKSPSTCRSLECLGRWKKEAQLVSDTTS
ncbi:hypothetical protein QBC36DRAFT_8226 [Triangularia setosa]|uniref:Uncharacterized protein n=1 Tax=Triangularia setosa TaxID=2587417 RepID=A0AAN6W6X5_9PEZI|nr:hypothetical protein QBC36DRAFT_8226 [Podospora setosa]